MTGTGPGGPGTGGPDRAGPDRSPHDRAELAARVLGLLDDAAARAVDAHLARCTPCRREWEELREMTDVLGEVPPEAALDGPPDGDLVLQRALRQVRTEARATRRWRRARVAVAAAAAVAVVLGGGLVAGRATAPESAVVAQTPGTVTLQGVGEPGVRMTADVVPAAGWVRLVATVQGIPAGERCRLVVITRDGGREIAGSWVVPPAGPAEGTTLGGSAAVSPEDVAGVVVENEQGREFVALRA
jgi:hypothetical protein